MICWFWVVLTVLGLGALTKVGFIVSISKPRTNALPGETLYNAKSSDGVPPAGVNWPYWYIPLFPTLSFKEFKTVISKGLVV